ncbi:hypothetical protein RMONA_07680 [Rickettsia monacensis]|uniref:Uncharacterized protein n=1 Tax=Rickettsia monacensis TaxID=109232 RepID=A0A0B7J153_9RICK|nr:hypothetical protein [Rickettsia monacensis]CDI29827.1 hypothetical protein RMONA_5930 [Rickettsia monacensis IrR/Munich]CEO17887.1 hypothetical protein RMONA_07680 [Rickettsia monacensis]
MPKQEDLRPYVKKIGNYTYYINPKGGTIVTEPNGDAYRYVNPDYG